MKRVLVAGATGYLGRYMVRTLKKQGFYIKVLVRDPSKLNQQGNFLAPPIGEYIDEALVGDVTKPDTLRFVCDHVDYVFSSVGITRQSKDVTFNDIDYHGNANLLKEAEYSQVDKFMYIHVCIDRSWEEPGPMIEAKNRFVDALIGSSIDHMIIRPTGYFSDITTFLTMAKRGRAYVFGNGKAKMNPIHGKDLAHFCSQSFTKTNKILDVGGPEMFSYIQMVQLAFDVLDKKEHITRIPLGLLKPVSVALKYVSKQNYGLYRFLFNVMTNDINAPIYGSNKLKDFFTSIRFKAKFTRLKRPPKSKII